MRAPPLEQGFLGTARWAGRANTSCAPSAEDRKTKSEKPAGFSTKFPKGREEPPARPLVRRPRRTENKIREARRLSYNNPRKPPQSPHSPTSFPHPVENQSPRRIAVSLHFSAGFCKPEPHFFKILLKTFSHLLVGSFTKEQNEPFRPFPGNIPGKNRKVFRRFSKGFQKQKARSSTRERNRKIPPPQKKTQIFPAFPQFPQPLRLLLLLSNYTNLSIYRARETCTTFAADTDSKIKKSRYTEKHHESCI